MTLLKYLGLICLALASILMLLLAFFIRAIKGGGRYRRQWKRMRKTKLNK